GKTSAILLYLEHLSDARRFVSAGGRASRHNPKHVYKKPPKPPPLSKKKKTHHQTKKKKTK
ncbi:hypothetical protein ACVGWD_00355, partial [Enterobacter asburiae]